MKRWIGLLAWTGLLSVLFLCVGLLAVTRASAPRGIGRPLAMADMPNPEAIAKRAERKVETSNDTLSRQIDALAKRLDAVVSEKDLLRKDLDSFMKDTDARFAKGATPIVKVDAPDNELPVIHGFSPTWFTCTACPRAKKESEAAGLPFHVEWSEIDQQGLKALGIPAEAKFPCFHWADAKGQTWYAWNDGSLKGETTMQGLERKWREHR